MALMLKLFDSGWRDIFAALKSYELAGVLGWQDIRQRYRRSSLGPFWLTISMGVLIGTLALVFGTIFKAPMKRIVAIPYHWVNLMDAHIHSAQ